MPAGPIQGVSFTRLGRRVYKQSVIENRDPRGRKYYWIAGTPQWDQASGTDYEAVSTGRISVTPLHLDLTYYPGLESFTPLWEKLSALSFPAGPAPRELMSDYAVQRERMVRDLIAARGVRDERVLAAMRKIPRHLFVKDHLRSQAYGDHALPIGSAQTISQPYIVARMSELLDVGPSTRCWRSAPAPATRPPSSPSWRGGSTASSGCRSWRRRRSRACASSASTTSRSRSSTAPWAGASGPPSTASWSPPARRRCRSRSSASSRRGAPC